MNKYDRANIEIYSQIKTEIKITGNNKDIIM